MYIIQTPCNFDDTDHDIETENIQNFEEANETFYKWIVNKNFISKRSEQVRTIEDAYRNAPLSGYFKNHYNLLHHTAADRNKSYPSLLKEIKYIPVFNESDNYEVYDNHVIEDYTKYIIEVMPIGNVVLPFGDENIESSIIFDEKISMVYGYVLNRITGFKYKVNNNNNNNNINKLMMYHHKKFLKKLLQQINHLLHLIVKYYQQNTILNTFGTS